MSKLIKRTHFCGVLNKNNIGEEVSLNGWVAKQRSLGSLIFVDLRDKTGIVQIVFDDSIPQEIFDVADRLRSEFVIIEKRTEPSLIIFSITHPPHHLNSCNWRN